MKSITYLIKGIFAGVMIAIGGIAYLSIEDKIVGSFIFSLGLFTVCVYSMNLYTGKIGYIVGNKISYLWELLLSIIGNFIGASTVGFIMNYTRFNSLSAKALTISLSKINDSVISIFILSIFCGILMFIAVNNYRKEHNEIGKYIGIFMCVMGFILCGFEHCVANIFYFSFAGIWTFKAFCYLLIMILGNSVGSIIISLYNYYYRGTK